MVVTAVARAKVNLTLKVLGRREDGFHELRSLIAFADGLADEITVIPAPDFAFSCRGPFAADVVGENLIVRASELLREKFPDISIGQVRLKKNLPVAAGIGGGSADVGAFLRVVRDAAHIDLDDEEWRRVAVRLGADVPVCFENSAAFVSGIGEEISTVASMPRLPAVLANPMVHVPADKTFQVFRALGAGDVAETTLSPVRQPLLHRCDQVLELVRSDGNDLERAAASIVPEIAEVKAALGRAINVKVVGLSGAGATCFALFDEDHAAKEAALRLQADQPTWWVQATTLC